MARKEAKQRSANTPGRLAALILVGMLSAGVGIQLDRQDAVADRAIINVA